MVNFDNNKSSHNTEGSTSKNLYKGIVEKYITGTSYSHIRDDFNNLISSTTQNQPFLLPFTLIAISAGDIDTATNLISRIHNKYLRVQAQRILSHQQKRFGIIAKSSSLVSAMKMTPEARLYAAIDKQDWVELFTLSWLLCDAIDEDTSEANLSLGKTRDYLAYAMIKLNLKYDLVQLLAKSASDELDFNHIALSSYVVYFERNYEKVIEMGRKIIPSKTRIPEDPFYSLIFEFFADSLLRTEGQEALRALVEEEKLLNGENSWWQLFSGLVDYDTDKESSIRKWESAAYSNTFCLNHAWGVNSYRSFGTLRFSDNTYTPIPGSAKLDQDRPVIVSCADEKYVRQFLPNMIHNIIKGPRVIWHYHLIIHQDDGLQEIIDFLLEHGNVSISVERCAIAPPRAYFTLPRFACTRSILRKRKGLVLMTDIDILVKDITKAIIALKQEKQNVGLHYSRFYSHFPWQKVQINISSYDTTKGSMDFLDSLIGWIEKVFDPKHNYQWWIDQVAVAMALSKPELRKSTFSLSRNFMSCFSFAGSSPDLKDKFTAEVAQNNPEIIKKIEKWMSRTTS